MRLRILLIVASAVLLGADASKEDAAKKDKETLQGTWKVIRAEQDGEQRDRDDLAKVRLLVVGDRLTIKDPRLGNEERVFQLAPDKKLKRIDLRDAETKEVNRGIYVLDGDDFKMCFAEPGKTRPTNFTAKAESGWTMLIAKRVKPK